MARPRFLIAAMDRDRALLQGQQAAHLATVLRARVGDEVEIAHEGAVYLARVAGMERGQVSLDVIAPLGDLQPATPIVLAAALFKVDRFEWMLEKACELGAATICPLLTQRTDARSAAVSDTRMRRWQRILQAAAEQSHRASPPELFAPQPLAHFLELPPPAGAECWIFSERGGLPPKQVRDAAGGGAVLLTGPEGGWVQAELDAARQAGYRAVSLGPLILRCETAILAALALAGAAIAGDRAAPPR